MVTDKQYKIYKDFYVTPIKRSQFSRGYLFSGFMITMILSLFTLLVAEIFIVVFGGSLLSATAFLKVLGIIALTAFANTSNKCLALGRNLQFRGFVLYFQAFPS